MLLAGGAKYHKTVALSSIWTPSFLQSSENIQSSTLLQVCLTPNLLWKMYSRLFTSYQTTLLCLHATNRPYYGASYHFIVSCSSSEIWHGDFKKVIKPTTIKLRRRLIISSCQNTETQVKILSSTLLGNSEVICFLSKVNFQTNTVRRNSVIVLHLFLSDVLKYTEPLFKNKCDVKTLQ